jgi:capsular polysaccharide biosynthesis protein
MSADPSAVDLGAEREIDLKAWLKAALAYWWMPVVGLIVGAVIGGVYAINQNSKKSYIATATISRGQAFNPAGSSIVQSYLTNLLAIQQYINDTGTLARVSSKTGVPIRELVGHVSAQTFTSQGQLATSNTGTILVGISATLSKARKAEDVANALATEVAKFTTTPYVLQSISFLKSKINHFKVRLTSLQTRINALNAVLNNPHNGLSPLDKLVVSTQLDAAQAAQGATLDSLTTAQQQLILAGDVEETHIQEPAVASKVPGHSKRNAVAVGAVLGLLIGAAAAIGYAIWTRRRKPQPAPA